MLAVFYCGQSGSKPERRDTMSERASRRYKMYRSGDTCHAFHGKFPEEFKEWNMLAFNLTKVSDIGKMKLEEQEKAACSGCDIDFF